jgi:hypothetical protein
VTTTDSGHRDAVLSFLTEQGTASTPHIFGDLLTHLEGVESLVKAWGGSDLLALVALGHATYGTDGFPPHILELSDRAVLGAAIGEEAEALVYFYASCDRSFFYPQLENAELSLADLRFRDRFTATELPPTATDVTQFVDLTYANEAELAAASPDGPKGWTWLADFCRRTRRWASPMFYDGAMALLQADT